MTINGDNGHGHHAGCECVLCLTVRSDQAIRYAMHLLAESAYRRLGAWEAAGYGS